MGAFGKMSGIDCRRFLRLPHPLSLLLIFSHSLPVLFPSCKFFETPAKPFKHAFTLVESIPEVTFVSKIRFLRKEKFFIIYLRNNICFPFTILTAVSCRKRTLVNLIYESSNYY